MIKQEKLLFSFVLSTFDQSFNEIWSETIWKNYVGIFLWRTRIIKGNQEEKKNYIGSIEVMIECSVWCKRKQICTSKLGMRNVTEIFFFFN